MNKRILVVDDEARIARLLSMRLKSLGYIVSIAYNGTDCVQIAKGEVPDLILMDIKMPFKDGIKAFEELIGSEITQSIPVIFMTAHLRIELKLRLVKMGATGFISKPFSDKEIEQTIAETLDNSI